MRFTTTTLTSLLILALTSSILSSPIPTHPQTSSLNAPKSQILPADGRAHSTPITAGSSSLDEICKQTNPSSNSLSDCSSHNIARTPASQSTTSLIFSRQTGFVNLAISQINALVTKIFTGGSKPPPNIPANTQEPNLPLAARQSERLPALISRNALITRLIVYIDGVAVNILTLSPDTHIPT